MGMKRLLAWLLAAIVLSCTCVGCGWEAADKAGNLPGTGPGLTYRSAQPARSTSAPYRDSNRISNSLGQYLPVTNSRVSAES